VQDNDAALGRLVDFVSHSSIWPRTAIFVTEDDAQGEKDHLSAHRTVNAVISPWAKRGAVVHTLTSTASVTKTIDELLGLAPSSTGDALATDLRDYFTTTPDYSPYTAKPFAAPTASAAGARIAALGSSLNTSSPDADSIRQARLSGLSKDADSLSRRHARMSPRAYARAQQRGYRKALAVVRGGAQPDRDG
jgi:hypothetical protein